MTDAIRLYAEKKAEEALLCECGCAASFAQEFILVIAALAFHRSLVADAVEQAVRASSIWTLIFDSLPRL